MQTKAKRAKKQEPAASAQHPPVFYRLHALLGTIRAIEGYEDQLCTLMHEVERTGTVNAQVSVELSGLLEEMPSSEYRDELAAVKKELEAASRVRSA